jgi:hypothetical protein
MLLFPITADLCSRVFFYYHYESLCFYCIKDSQFLFFFCFFFVYRQKITVNIISVSFFKKDNKHVRIKQKTCDFVDMSELPKTNDESKSLDNLLDEALTGFNETPTTTTTTKETTINSSDTAPPPSDPLQTTFEAMCFNDEKFLNELDSLPNFLSNFPFGLGETNENDSDNNNIFNLFSQLGKHADLLQKINDEDIEKALEKLADQSGTTPTTTSVTTTENEPHVEQLNSFMSGILSKGVMLPACQAVDESYEEWLVKNKDSLTDEEFQRYTKQHQCVKEICREYDTSSDDGQQIQRVLQKFQQLQTFGDPPKELLFFPGLPGFGGFGSGEQNLFGDAFSDADKAGQSEADCCLM